ncbi:MAG: glycosyltransferase family 2 protein [Solirubrobacterales bacterium]|nr:glycosyltransferase family 2 protein [Solirubrobacterales bacterium]
MKFSVVIPARDEQGSIATTVESARSALKDAGIDYEIVVVDDGSSDSTASIVESIGLVDPAVRCLVNQGRHGFGLAIRAGLASYTGDAVAIMMADGSDSADDLVKYARAIESGYDCAFGSRFIAGAKVHDYPRYKLLLNRIVNFGIRILFRHGYNDTTNAFKAYSRPVIDASQPLLSEHFNLTVELPLKAITRGCTYTVMPISWTNRAAGESKLRLQEMGSRYLFIVLYVFLEAHLSRGDYRRRGWSDPDAK